ncbi:hypothetical protein BRADI_1g28995v3 [Brachypodium distachyon]|uniref:Uncharacterized protein n=1 Tax=Brachypodium distachyon TaxID=15368 RepID=A0A0Q3JER5_BRADI|nr:hypothetical protein BRADI_1g28995v3 [Brachypodium distachyon]
MHSYANLSSAHILNELFFSLAGPSKLHMHSLCVTKFAAIIIGYVYCFSPYIWRCALVPSSPLVRLLQDKIHDWRATTQFCFGLLVCSLSIVIRISKFLGGILCIQIY